MKKIEWYHANHETDFRYVHSVCAMNRCSIGEMCTT